MRDDFSDRFAVLCALRGLTCTRLAHVAKVDESMSSRWLRGLQRPRNRADVVKRALGMTMAEFYSFDVAAGRAELKSRDREQQAREAS